MQVAPFLIVATFLAASTPALGSGATIFQSGTLGSTGVLWQELGPLVPGTNVASFSFVGARFEIDAEFIATRIGGHFAGGFPDDSFFGVLVTLSGEADFPDSGDFSTPDVLGIAHLTFPHPSAEAFGTLSAMLEPGWYAVVFGTNFFGATGRGGAVRNGQDIGSPSYIGLGSEGWRDLPDFFDNHRFVVEGDVIPEPSTATLIAVIPLLSILRERKRRQEGMALGENEVDPKNWTA